MPLQSLPCRDSVSFTGTVKETGENFFYRIYDRELFHYAQVQSSQKERKHRLKQKQSSSNADAMNNTELMKKYVPPKRSACIMWTTGRIDEREDSQEQCIRNNNMGRLYETKNMECYAEQEAKVCSQNTWGNQEKMAEEKGRKN